ncbi:MAG: transglutaminase-like domain-containing protein [Chloroflexi bacterium]|nr:transglutaminase-like domain-containing protein [Chloroflexota bacterium]
MLNKLSRIFIIALALIVLLPGVYAASPPDQQGKPVHEEWHKILFWGEPITFEKYTVEEMPDGNLSVKSDMKSAVLQDAVRQETETTVGCIVKPDFTPVSFVRTEITATEEKTVSGKIKDGKLTLEFSTPGMNRTEEMLFPPGTYFFNTIEEILRHEELTPGKLLTYPIFDEGALSFGMLAVKVIGKEQHKVGDEMPELMRLQIENTLLPGVVMIQWMDDKNQVVETEAPALGLTLYRSSEKEASTPLKLPQMAAIRYIQSNFMLIPMNRVSRLTMRLVSQDSNIGDIAVNDVTQRLEVFPPDLKTGLLTVDKINTTTLNPLSLPVEGLNLNPYLAPTQYVQSMDPDIQNIAREIVGNEKDSWKAALLINDWVFRNLRKGQINASFASAREVLRSREGDCTEHTVLFAALARASGIPVRANTGLYYNAGTFGYHMWPEVFVGEWVPVDPTFGQTPADPGHIILGTGSLDDASRIQFAIGLLRSIKRLDISIMSFTMGGKTYRVERPGTGGIIKDGRYINKIYSVEMEAAGGWKFSEDPRNGYMIFSLAPADPGTAITLFGEMVPEKTTSEQYFKIQIPTYKKMVENFKVVKAGYIKEGKEKTYRVYFSGRSGEINFVMIQYIYVHDGIAYVLASTYPVSLEKNYLPKVKEMMNTFHFIK